MCVGNAVGVKANLGYAAKVSEPNAQVGVGLSNVIVVSRHSAKRDGIMMRHDENKVANCHLVGERKVVALTNADGLWVGEHEVARLALEVEADESGAKAACGILRCS